MQKLSIKILVTLLRDSFRELTKNDPLRMAGATAFFTTFALPPILIILIQVLGLVMNPRTIRSNLFKNLSGIVGEASMDQVINTLEGFSRLAQNWFITIGGFLFLLFIATTLFKVIKSSVNQVWKIRIVEHKNIMYRVVNRLRAIAVILVAGVLFLGGLLAEGFQVTFGKYLNELWPHMAIFFTGGLNLIISILIVTAWFCILFRYLPDGRPSWRVAFAGGLMTSLLFNTGKLLLRWLLSYSNIDTIYGASGSIVLLLLFVFYSSLILYYGAAFTKIWSEFSNRPIQPKSHAAHYLLSDDESP